MAIEQLNNVNQSLDAHRRYYEAVQLQVELDAVEFDPRNCVVATTTFYSKFSNDPQTLDEKNDTARGSFALNMARNAFEKGFNLIIVDGGSSPAFEDLMMKQNKSVTDYEGTFVWLKQKEPGMSGARREAIAYTLNIPIATVGVWTEPEKEDFVKYGLLKTILPVLKGEADFVVPYREQMVNYPWQQAEQEMLADRLWEESMKRHALINPDEIQRPWFGPRAFKITQENIDLMMRKFNFEGNDNFESHRLAKKHQDAWVSCLYYPLIAAAATNRGVTAVGVEYHHPIKQKQIEEDPQMSTSFAQKRVEQRTALLTQQWHKISYMNDGPSALKRVR